MASGLEIQRNPSFDISREYLQLIDTPQSKLLIPLSNIWSQRTFDKIIWIPLPYLEYFNCEGFKIILQKLLVLVL